MSLAKQVNSQEQEGKQHQDDSECERLAVHVVSDLLCLPTPAVATATTAPEAAATNEEANTQQSTNDSNCYDRSPPPSKLNRDMRNI